MEDTAKSLNQSANLILKLANWHLEQGKTKCRLATAKCYFKLTYKFTLGVFDFQIVVACTTH